MQIEFQIRGMVVLQSGAECLLPNMVEVESNEMKRRNRYLNGDSYITLAGFGTLPAFCKVDFKNPKNRNYPASNRFDKSSFIQLTLRTPFRR